MGRWEMASSSEESSFPAPTSSTSGQTVNIGVISHEVVISSGPRKRARDFGDNHGEGGVVPSANSIGEAPSPPPTLFENLVQWILQKQPDDENVTSKANGGDDDDHDDGDEKQVCADASSTIHFTEAPPPHHAGDPTAGGDDGDGCVAGWVHEALAWSEDVRQLFVDRALPDPGTMLFRIPAARILSSSFPPDDGPSGAGPTWSGGWPPPDHHQENSTIMIPYEPHQNHPQPPPGPAPSDSLSPEARPPLYLHDRPQERGLAGILARAGASSSVPHEAGQQALRDRWAPYLDSLPSPETLQLPRHWAPAQKQWLQGSPLHRRLDPARQQVEEDYQRLVQAWKQARPPPPDPEEPAQCCPPPDTAPAASGEHVPKGTFYPPFSLAVFRHAMDFVSSRAFGAQASGSSMHRTEDDDDLLLMIPLLDLCNHQRGRPPRPSGDSGRSDPDRHHDLKEEEGAPWNVSYRMIWQQPTDQRPELVAVVATTLRPLSAGEVLTITYGARGNAQLLFNYGFCLSTDNLEPDGSSNDVWEFILPTSHANKDPNDDDHHSDASDEFVTVAELRTGPKSYTYGNFVKAVEYFYPGPDRQESGKLRRDPSRQQVLQEEDDDLRAFLDDCERDEQQEDDEEEEGDDMSGLMHCWGDEKANGGSSPGGDSTALEVQALATLSQNLREKLSQYAFSPEELTRTLASKEPSPKYYSAVLVDSEQRTIKFFLRAALSLQAKLMDKKEEVMFNSDIPIQLDPLREKQVEELVSAYIRIRHPNLCGYDPIT